MEDSTLKIYINPEERIEDYPQSLSGDMSVFNGFRNEVQWLFYLLLRDRFPGLTLCRDYPEEGILIIHKGNAKKFVWNPDLFVVSPQWDYSRDDRAQIHLVSNQEKTMAAAGGWLDRLSGEGLKYCVPPIMHPHVVPRDPARGDRLENVVFMGEPKNLDEAFLTTEFKDRLAELGMKFIVEADPHKHADFSNVDVSLAVRKIGKVIQNKPAVKLYNAWRGHVPALLGCEVGFREVRTSEDDYLEVDSVDDVIEALSRLKIDTDFREKMINNARERGKAYTAEAQQQRWGDFFERTVVPAYEDWMKMSRIRRRFILTLRWARYQLRERGSYFLRKVLGIRPKQYHH